MKLASLRKHVQRAGSFYYQKPLHCAIEQTAVHVNYGTEMLLKKGFTHGTMHLNYNLDVCSRAFQVAFLAALDGQHLVQLVPEQKECLISFNLDDSITNLEDLFYCLRIGLCAQGQYETMMRICTKCSPTEDKLHKADPWTSIMEEIGRRKFDKGVDIYVPIPIILKLGYLRLIDRQEQILVIPLHKILVFRKPGDDEYLREVAKAS